MAEELQWWKKRVNLLKLILTIIALDYLIIGLIIIFLPDLLGPPTPATAINFGQTNLITGIFALFLSRDPETYEKLIWVQIWQEIALNIVGIYQIFTEVVTLTQEGSVILVHVIYLVILVLLMVFKDKFPDTNSSNPQG